MRRIDATWLPVEGSGRFGHASPRVKKRTQRRQRSQHESELLGLALAALGLVLSAILYLGLDGGAVGSGLAGALSVRFSATPRTCFRSPSSGSGSLMLARSDRSTCGRSAWAWGSASSA